MLYYSKSHPLFCFLKDIPYTELRLLYTLNIFLLSALIKPPQLNNPPKTLLIIIYDDYTSKKRRNFLYLAHCTFKILSIFALAFGGDK